jgi:putative tryptophan/tyrosine transport system substrate-binding protein
MTIARRRFFAAFAGIAAAWPLAARAQQPERMQRVGLLMSTGNPEDDPESRARIAAFQQGLERLGWSDGRNVRIDYRFAPGGIDAQMFAKELLALQPDVVLAQGTPIVSPASGWRCLRRSHRP